MPFKIISDFVPTGDQPEAIRQLTDGLNAGVPYQTLLGVTGSGKTFTIANVIEQVQRPTLVLSHNKTLAAQLYGEFKTFFPENAVEYFVSYYDYYQPEAYIPVTDTYIEKDLSINAEIEKLRLSATAALLSGRRDVIIVASVSCIYGIGNPDDFHSNTISIRKGQKLARNKFLRMLVDSLYSRNEVEFTNGTFRVRGDSVDIYIAYGDVAYRVLFWGDDIEELEIFNPLTGGIIDKPEYLTIYPANIFVTTKERIKSAIHQIQDDLVTQVGFFHEIAKNLEAKRLEDRVNFDLE
jgi:excinuclease ABC subunit B